MTNNADYADYLEFRGGCICVMKYGYYALDTNYLEVVRDFDGIAAVLTVAIKACIGAGFDALRIYLFGFSLGSRVCLYAASKLPKQTVLEQMDLCDPAGYGFDGHPEHNDFDYTNLAQRVCCMHTSRFFGTSERRCDVDWNLGECGTHQVAAVGISDSHKLCTMFWNSAFRNRFYAVSGSSLDCPALETDVTLPGDGNSSTSRYYMGYKDQLYE